MKSWALFTWLGFSLATVAAAADDWTLQSGDLQFSTEVTTDATITLSDRPSYITFTTGWGGQYNEIVRIDMKTGIVTYGDRYTPDAAARVFWESIGHYPHKEAPAGCRWWVAP